MGIIAQIVLRLVIRLAFCGIYYGWVWLTTPTAPAGPQEQQA